MDVSLYFKEVDGSKDLAPHSMIQGVWVMRGSTVLLRILMRFNITAAFDDLARPSAMMPLK